LVLAVIHGHVLLGCQYVPNLPEFPWLAVLAIAQMGVHLVFFLHITTGPDNTNNVLALRLACSSSSCRRRLALDHGNLNDNMLPPPELMNLHMQH
jgi:cytochrome o ubiquinol oxidase operon protein cyoD